MNAIIRVCVVNSWAIYERFETILHECCSYFQRPVIYSTLFTQLQAYDWLHYVYIRVVPLLCERWILV